MTSLIKTSVNIAITPHVELIHQLILDGLEMANFYKERRGSGYCLKSGAIYYRNMRQTGHSAALRSLYKSPKFENINVLSVFMSTVLVSGARIDVPKEKTHYIQSDHKFRKPGDNTLRGIGVDVLIMNDYLSANSMERGWQVVEQILSQRPDIKLVVFLG